MNARKHNIRYLGNYIKENYDEPEKIKDATLILESIKNSKKYGNKKKVVPNK